MTQVTEVFRLATHRDARAATLPDWGRDEGGNAVYIDLGADSSSGGQMGIQVEPDKLLQLKQGFETHLEEVRTWLFENQDHMIKIPPPGNDPCSRDAMDVLGQNGQAAIDKAKVYVERLESVINKLHENAVAYGLVEDENKDKFRQVPE